jgi:GNAT superfamily N-acetyltransferase
MEIISFNEIAKVWSTQLWIGRKDIEPVSAMTFDRSYDMQHFNLPAYYYGLRNGNELIGVNSCHRCSDGSMRSRGLWVHEDFRGRGLGLQLLQHAIYLSSSSTFCWSLPRLTSWPVYEKAGFVLTSSWFSTDTSPKNAYVKYDIQK